MALRSSKLDSYDATNTLARENVDALEASMNPDASLLLKLAEAKAKSLWASRVPYRSWGMCVRDGDYLMASEMYDRALTRGLDRKTRLQTLINRAVCRLRRGHYDSVVSENLDTSIPKPGRPFDEKTRLYTRRPWRCWSIGKALQYQSQRLESSWSYRGGY